MTDRQGVEVDYCPQCRGMWLDRGELDKVLERAAAALQATQPVGQNRESERRDDYRDDRRRSDDDRDRGGHREAGPYPRKKKGGFLGELFEFGD